MGIFSGIKKIWTMTEEQKKLIAQGYSEEEAVGISRMNYLINKYKDLGYTKKEAKKLAEAEYIEREY